MYQPTNAAKAAVATFVNGWLGVAAAFEVGTQAQLGALGIALNATFGLYLVATYRLSPKRVPDEEG